uniref:Uncharacterized protein n=1 Tax=Tanacetum cinerariifolium TaxID=118510 RepID=A0A6L2MUL2_TANCI|nr:hypothetical protein [Tanacetum cinerariifolium]
MKECHKMLTDQVDWTNPEGDQVRANVNRPLPLDGPPDHVTIHTQFFFNKYFKYLRYGSKGSSSALWISKMKVVSYPNFGLELLMPEQIWIDDMCTYDISAKYGISHCIKSYQTQLNLTKPGWDATGYEFKHDYTIIESPRAVVFPVNNNEQQIMRLQYNTHDIDLLNGMTISFRSLKKSVVNITNSSTNKAFQVLIDPSRLQSPFNSRYELFAPCQFLDSVSQCFQNPCQCAVTELVYFIEPHDLLFIVVDREHYCSRRLNDEHCGFGEVESSLIAFHSKLNIFYPVLDHGSSNEHEKSIVEVF